MKKTNNFRNNKQVDNIYATIEELDRLLNLLESPYLMESDIDRIRDHMQDTLRFYSDNIDELRRKWLKSKVVADIDRKFEVLVKRFNMVNESLNSEGLVNFGKDDELINTWGAADSKISNEMEIFQNPENQKRFKTERRVAIAKQIGTLVAMGSLVLSLALGGVSLKNARVERNNAMAQAGQLQTEKDEALKNIETLLKEISRLQGIIENNANLSAEEKEALNAEILRLQQELNSALAENAGLKAENEDLKNKIEEIEGKITEKENLIEELYEIINNNAGQDVSSYIARIAELEEEVEVLKAEKASLQTENAALKSQLATLNSNYNTLKDQNAKLTQENKNLLSQNKELGDKIAKLEVKIGNLQATIDGQIIQIGNLTTENNRLKSELEKVKKDLEEALKNGGLSEEQKAVYEARIKELENQIKEKDAKISQMTKDYSNLLNQYGAVVAEKDALLNENNLLTDGINKVYFDLFGDYGDGLSAEEKIDRIKEKIASYVGLGGNLSAESYDNMRTILVNLFGYPASLVEEMSNVEVEVAYWLAYYENGLLPPQPGDEPTNDSVHEGQQGENTQNPGNNNGSQNGDGEPGDNGYVNEP